MRAIGFSHLSTDAKNLRARHDSALRNSVNELPNDHAQLRRNGAKMDVYAPEYRVFLAPASDDMVVDSGDAAGLMGTSSHDRHIEGAFVPRTPSLLEAGSTMCVRWPLT